MGFSQPKNPWLRRTVSSKEPHSGQGLYALTDFDLPGGYGAASEKLFSPFRPSPGRSLEDCLDGSRTSVRREIREDALVPNPLERVVMRIAAVGSVS